MTLYPGRVGAKIEVAKEETQAIIKDMKKLSASLKTDAAVTRKEVSDYLLFRHAPERNVALGDGAAGVTTQKAKEGLAAIEKSAQGKEVKAIADRVQNLNNQTLELLKDSGVISDKLFV